MKINLDRIAFHEAGHAVAHILACIPFKYITIKEDKEKDEHGQRSLGHVEYDNPMTPEEWDKHSILNPSEFNMYFKDDFIKLAGLIAEGIYRHRFNYKASKNDFRQWGGLTSLNKLPDRLESRYIDFMLEYTSQVLQNKANWSNITAIALALVEEETLTYGRVCEVIEQNQLNPVLL